MEVVYKSPKSMCAVPTHYCPGCGHGIVHKLIGELIDELSLKEKTVGVAPVGCAVLIYDYFEFDMCESPHGRAPAIATGIKRSKPELFVFTYQGDGDLAAIGMAEIIHAANRSENFTTIFINNAIYGMTGGQLAPTTLIGQKTTTTPSGRTIENEGPPIRMCEMLATLDGPVYIERTSVANPAGVNKTKKAIKKAFMNQLENKGFSFVEVLAMCPTGWALDPVQSLDYVKTSMANVFPLGVFTDRSNDKSGDEK